MERPHGRIGELMETLEQQRARAAARQRQITARQADTAQRPTALPPEPAPQREIGLLERAADNIFGLDNGYESAGEVAASALNKAGESLTLGVVGDEVAGKFDEMIGRREAGTGVEFYRQQERDLKANHPVISTVAEIAPAFIPGAGMTTLAAKGASLFGRAATGAAMGATSAGVYGGMEGEDGSRAKSALNSALIGGVFGAAAPRAIEALSGIPRALFSMVKRAETRPTVQLLQATKNAAYRAVDESGETFGADEMAGLAKTVREVFEDGNYVEEVDNASRAALSILDRRAGQPTTLSQLDGVRQNLWKRYASAQDQPQILDAIKSIDDLVASREGTSELMTVAREANSRYAKSQLIEDAFTRATDQSAATGSGGNILNKYRQAVTGIINNPSKARFFSEDEIGLMRSFVRGSNSENMRRLVGKLSPSGNGLMMALHTIGGVATGGASVPLMMVGAGAKASADKSVMRGADQIQNVLSGHRAITQAPQLTQVGAGAATAAGAIGQNVEQRFPNIRPR